MLVSVIIPSAGQRPELLQRAIKSALIDNDEIQTEIIVVLNGTEGMSFDISKSFQHPLVEYYKIEQGNVSKARNYGLSIAKGALIRFLDDDDFLYPDVAYQQYVELYNSDADLSTYAGTIEDDTTRYQVVEPIDIDDYCAATLSAKCPALTFATIYKLRAIHNLKWDEDIFIAEDENWMRKIASNSEIKWIRNNYVVAVWYQHHIARLSFPYAHPDFGKNRFKSIVETLKYLEVNNRLTNTRKYYAVQGIWSSIHNSFFFSPIFWTIQSFVARKISKDSKPEHLRNIYIPKCINPIIIEWIFLPKRYFNHMVRVVKYRLNIGNFIRKG